MTELLRNAISQLYVCFSQYPLKSKIDGCPHCELGIAEAGLHNKPLESLSWDDLKIFSFKAMTTFGDLDDFKHFLPRIFELLAIDYENAPHEAEIILGKLNYGKWREWSREEQEVIGEFIRRWRMSPLGSAENAEEVKQAITKLKLAPT